MIMSLRDLRYKETIKKLGAMKISFGNTITLLRPEYDLERCAQVPEYRS